jgi:hypothetical protein
MTTPSESLLADLRETRERMDDRGAALRALLLAKTAPGDVVAEGWFYLPTFLVDDKYGDGTCTLLVRHITAKRAAKAGFRCTIKTDALDFPDEAKLHGWIRHYEAEELPPEADGNPRYLPTRFAALGRIK